MKKINVKHLPSEWKCIWLFPINNSVFYGGIQAWEWVRDYEAYAEDEYLNVC